MASGNNKFKKQKLYVIVFGILSILCIWCVWSIFTIGLNIFDDSSDGNNKIGFVGSSNIYYLGDPVIETCVLNGNMNYSFHNATYGFGLLIESNNITIDGSYFTIKGPGEKYGDYEGIHIRGYEHITIKNLNIQGFNFGIYIEDSHSCRIVNNNITYGMGSGIWLLNSSNCEILDNNITCKDLNTGEQGHGILITSSSCNNILRGNNVITKKGGGVFIEGNSNNNELYSNFLCGNMRGDIKINLDCTGTIGANNCFCSSENYNDIDGNPSTYTCPEYYIQAGIPIKKARPASIHTNDTNIGFVSNINSSNVFSCGSIITKSCTLNSDLLCDYADGIIIGADNITIDGNGYTLDGGIIDDCSGTVPICGILNEGHSNVIIKNLEIKNFCIGINFEKGESENTVNNCTIDHCEIHDIGNEINGDNSQGIRWYYVSDSVISNSKIYNVSGTGDGCDSGGNGIFIYAGENNTMINNEIHNNLKAGIYTKMKPKYNTISNNNVNGNGQGGIVLRCKLSSFFNIEHNTVTNNVGAGIYIGGPSNTVKYNTINNNTIGTSLDEVSMNGNGIRVSRDADDTVIDSNVVSGNEDEDIYVKEELIGITGFNNTCNTYKGPDDQKPIIGKIVEIEEIKRPELSSPSMSDAEVIALAVGLVLLLIFGYGYSRRGN